MISYSKDAVARSLRSRTASIICGVLLLGTTSIVARAENCSPRDFMISDVTSIQQSSETQIAFVLTATEQEYNNAKKNIAGGGSYGLFSGNLNYSDAQQRARQIAQAIKFDYMSSYASNYFSQSISGNALKAYELCLDRNQNTPGLAIWVDSRAGDFITFGAFWVGKDTNVMLAKYDGDPVFAGGTLISKPDVWQKAKIEHVVMKRDSNNDVFLNLKVGGEVAAQVVVKDPPQVQWAKATVLSPNLIRAASSGPDPGCSAGQANDCIYPSHPGGYFVSRTRTMTQLQTNQPGQYSENYYIDSPDQVCVKMTQSTGSCQITGSAQGRLTAQETYPQAGQ